MSVQFSAAAQRQFEEYLRRYPTKRAAIMPTLWLAQREFGYLSGDVLEYVAGLINESPAFVSSVASFYTMYYKKPMGKHHVQICTNLSCALMGAEKIVAVCARKLGIGLGETTPDGQFSLDEVECLASCGTAPMMQINDDYWENLTPERTLELIERLGR
ncbi:MAG TPA: NAD(P)H-dependent oxidoreductase subunit E [Candidatus Kryptonia bacterium]|nr:NAD(P)H-dependent oxidoreductase subunit E [Candidatus Kryptonia bacterium]